MTCHLDGLNRFVFVDFDKYQLNGEDTAEHDIYGRFVIFVGNQMIGCIHVILYPNSLVVSFRRIVCRQAMPQISEARRFPSRSRAYQGVMSSREERTLRRQFFPPRSRAPRSLLSCKRVAREVTRSSRLSARVLTGLQRGAQKRGVSLSDPALSYRERVANDPEDSEGELPRARTATEKRKLVSALKRQKQVSTQGCGAAFGNLSILEKESVGPDVQALYGQHVRTFLKVFPGANPKKTADKAIDTFMTSYMNTLYLEGNDANVGDKLIAAWIYHYLEVGKRGHRFLPRVTRAV